MCCLLVETKLFFLFFFSLHYHKFNLLVFVYTGYYTRVQSIKEYVSNFLELTKESLAPKTPRQIVLLGSGLDSLGMTLMEEKHNNLIVYEVDFQPMIHKKLAMIVSNPSLLREIDDHASSLLSIPKDGPPIPCNDDTLDEDDDEFSSSMPPPKTTQKQHMDLLLSSYNIDSVCPSPQVKPSNRASTRNRNYCLIDPEKNAECSGYYFLSCDLRDSNQLILDLHAIVSHITQNNALEMNVPTLFVTECVLVYMDKQSSNQLLTNMLSKEFYNEDGVEDVAKPYFNNACWCSYDMTNPNDAFGKVMLKNLTQANPFNNRVYDLSGLVECPTLDMRVSQFLLEFLLPNTNSNTSDSLLNTSPLVSRECSIPEQNSIYAKCTAMTMLHVYDRIISKEEKQRISRIEMLDELEEFNLLMSHYAYTISCHSENPDATCHQVYDTFLAKYHIK